MLDHSPAPSPETGLWQEVLFRAVLDARLSPDLWPVPHRHRNDCIAARAYLTHPSEDLAMVCSMAGVDMVALIERVRAQIEKAPPSEALVPVPRRRRKATKHA